MAITEALACATPVVITDARHFPEVADAQAGIIVSLDPKAVADGIAAILDDRAKAAQMGKNGRRLVMDTFTWPIIAAMTIQNYRLSA
jgi:glycosyltransferase involved in cell wall biosynthesis